MSHEDFGGSGGSRGAGCSGGSWGLEGSEYIGALGAVKALGTLEWTWVGALVALSAMRDLGAL